MVPLATQIAQTRKTARHQYYFDHQLIHAEYRAAREQWTKDGDDDALEYAQIKCVEALAAAHAKRVSASKAKPTIQYVRGSNTPRR